MIPRYYLMPQRANKRKGGNLSPKFGTDIKHVRSFWRMIIIILARFMSDPISIPISVPNFGNKQLVGRCVAMVSLLDRKLLGVQSCISMLDRTMIVCEASVHVVFNTGCSAVFDATVWPNMLPLLHVGSAFHAVAGSANSDPLCSRCV